MIIRLFILFFVIGFWGCSSVTAPAPAGKGEYIIIAHVDFQFNSAGKALTRASSKAVEHCEEMGKEYELLDTRHTEKAGLESVYEIRYRCN